MDNPVEKSGEAGKGKEKITSHIENKRIRQKVTLESFSLMS